jgi:spore coat polysaccharide biosynthesis protein SpsF
MPEGQKKHTVVSIVQARMNSSRLPGKVLIPIAGHPMLNWVVERARMSQLTDDVWVATTTDPSDDAIAAYCHKQGYPLYRGSEQDVLDRFYQAAKLAKADVVVRLTADCPMIDPGLIDDVITALIKEQADFAATRLPPPFHRTYPIGLDVEAVHFTGLEKAWQEAATQYQREHVMPFFYEQEGQFKVVVLNAAEGKGSYRWTVDTAEDLQLVEQLAAAFDERRDFSWQEVLAYFDTHPELHGINASVRHKTFKDVDNRTNQNAESSQ